MNSTKAITLSLLVVGCLWGIYEVASLRLFNIPSPAMENTVPVGSKIVVKKSSHQPNRFGMVVYYNPMGDSVVVSADIQNYYLLKQSMGAEELKKRHKVEFVPLHDREIWLGRCVGLPGDKIMMADGLLYVNGKLYENEQVKKSYEVSLKPNMVLDPSAIVKLQIGESDLISMGDRALLMLTTRQLAQLKRMRMVAEVIPSSKMELGYDNSIFPHSERLGWNRNNLGSLTIPRKEVPIPLSLGNIEIYRRIITVYEGCSLTVADGKIYIDGKQIQSFTPKKSYFYIVNDNRDNSMDSRYWGFLPEDHLFGAVLKVI